jgi:hypothetical protein
MAYSYSPEITLEKHPRKEPFMKRIAMTLVSLSFALSTAHAAEVLKCDYTAPKAADSVSAYVVPNPDGSSNNVVLADPNRPSGSKVLGHFRGDKQEVGFDDEGIQLKNDIAKEKGDGINENEIILGTRMSMIHDLHLALSKDLSSATLRADFRTGESRAEPIFVTLTCSQFMDQAPAAPEALHEIANK